MKIPQLRKQTEKKNCHGYSWEDDYSWIHQDNCLEILRDRKKLVVIKLNVILMETWKQKVKNFLVLEI